FFDISFPGPHRLLGGSAEITYVLVIRCLRTFTRVPQPEASSVEDNRPTIIEPLVHVAVTCCAIARRYRGHPPRFSLALVTRASHATDRCRANRNAYIVGKRPRDILSLRAVMLVTVQAAIGKPIRPERIEHDVAVVVVAMAMG